MKILPSAFLLALSSFAAATEWHVDPAAAPGGGVDCAGDVEFAAGLS